MPDPGVPYDADTEWYVLRTSDPSKVMQRYGDPPTAHLCLGRRHWDWILSADVPVRGIEIVVLNAKGVPEARFRCTGDVLVARVVVGERAVFIPGDALVELPKPRQGVVLLHTSWEDRERVTRVAKQVEAMLGSCVPGIEVFEALSRKYGSGIDRNTLWRLWTERMGEATAAVLTACPRVGRGVGHAAALLLSRDRPVYVYLDSDRVLRRVKSVDERDPRDGKEGWEVTLISPPKAEPVNEG